MQFKQPIKFPCRSLSQFSSVSQRLCGKLKQAMKLVVLGSGTSIPHARRAASGYWLETDSGTILLDISADIPHRLAQEELDWPNLDAIWISHFHLDHLGGLAPFLFGTRNAPEVRQRTRPLGVYGPSGFVNILEAINESNNYRLLQQPFPVELKEVGSGDEFELLPGINGLACATPHTKESLAIRLTDKNDTVIVYTSDTGYADELSEFANHATVLLTECSFPKNKPVNTHLELAEAMQIAEKCKPEKLVLSHEYFEWDGIDLANEAQKLWPGETIEAFDGLRLEF